jgi:hypothetical protein
VPPIAVLVHLAWRALADDAADGEAGSVAWIGRRVWPYPHALLTPPGADGRVGQGGPDLVRCSLFVDPPGDAERLWAIDLALRCPGFTAVIADGAGLAMAQSRRLQLAAASGRALGLIARPPEEWGMLSAAATRWWMGPDVADGAPPRRAPRWALTLWRCKGRQRRSDHGRAGDLPRSWVLEQDRAQGALRLAADVVDRSDRAPATTAFIERDLRTA